MEKLKIQFWKIYGIIFDLRPRIHLPKYTDFPIASCDISDKYVYPKEIKILFEWNEKGRHWIVFKR
jgi:hypothetical protein